MLNNGLIFIICYLLGSLNFSIIISKVFFKQDVRDSGSHNAGSTNMLRTFGLKAALATFFLDVLRGFLCMHFLGLFGALGVIYGQMFPIFFKFRGGKGIATAAGIILAAEPIFGSIIIITGFAIAGITGYVSLGSIVCMASFPIWAYLKGGFNFFVWAFFISTPVLIKHYPNIKRLINHTENRLLKR